MNQRMDEWIRQWLDGVLSEADAVELLAELGRDPELLREVRRQYRVHRLLDAQHDLAVFGERVSRSIAAFRDERGAERLAARVTLGIHEQAEAQKRADSARGRRQWWPLLALAASLAIVAGWWFVHNPQPAPSGSVVTEMGLRVAEVAGEAVIGDRLSVIGDRLSVIGDRVRSPESSKGVPAVVGMELRQGDWVAVKAGGKVGLKYDGEGTLIDLHSASASFSTEQGAKRVRLESGLLRCTAAPQAKPFRFETPHGVVTVMGTQFDLDAGKEETTLAVRAGTVALSHAGRALEVKAGETAVADGAEMQRVASEDAWLRDLLIRAETGSWETLDLGKGTFAQGKWRMDTRGSAAERLMWNVDPDPENGMIVTFDSARWRRGVLTGRIMTLEDGTPAPVAPVIGDSEKPRVNVYGVSMNFGHENPIHLMLYTNDLGRSRGAGVSLSRRKPIPTDRWQELAVYFDVDGAEMPLSIYAVWPEDGRCVPPASEWTKGMFGALPRGVAAGFGLMVAPGCRVVVKGLKFVPLGADMPLPPNALLDSY